MRFAISKCPQCGDPPTRILEQASGITGLIPSDFDDEFEYDGEGLQVDYGTSDPLCNSKGEVTVGCGKHEWQTAVDEEEDEPGAVQRIELQLSPGDRLVLAVADGGGQVLESLVDGDDDNDVYKNVIEGVERLTLACACAGIAVDQEPFFSALSGVLEAIANEHV